MKTFLKCKFGKPIIILAQRKIQYSGTIWWLVCPRWKKVASHLEANGFLKKLENNVNKCEELLYAYTRSMYFNEFFTNLTAGIGGRSGGIKCFHAEIAYWLATGQSACMDKKTVNLIKNLFNNYSNICNTCKLK